MHYEMLTPDSLDAGEMLAASRKRSRWERVKAWALAHRRAMLIVGSGLVLIGLTAGVGMAVYGAAHACVLYGLWWTGRLYGRDEIRSEQLQRERREQRAMDARVERVMAEIARRDAVLAQRRPGLN